MRHTWKGSESDPHISTCKVCAKQIDWTRGEQDENVRSLYEQCGGADAVARHDWATAPGDMGYLKPQVCRACGKSQDEVHPHSPCYGKSIPEPTPEPDPAAIPERRVLELRRAAVAGLAVGDAAPRSDELAQLTRVYLQEIYGWQRK